MSTRKPMEYTIQQKNHQKRKDARGKGLVVIVVPLPISVEWEKGTVTQTLPVREALSVVQTTAKTSGLGHPPLMTAVSREKDARGKGLMVTVVPLPISVELVKGTVTQILPVMEALSVV